MAHHSFHHFDLVEEPYPFSLDKALFLVDFDCPHLLCLPVDTLPHFAKIAGRQLHSNLVEVFEPTFVLEDEVVSSDLEVVDGLDLLW